MTDLAPEKSPGVLFDEGQRQVMLVIKTLGFLSELCSHVPDDHTLNNVEGDGLGSLFELLYDAARNGHELLSKAKAGCRNHKVDL